MLTTIEGVYKGGRIELSEIPEGTEERRGLVTFLASSTAIATMDWTGHECVVGIRVGRW